ncbi:hypothetical protein NPIL_194521 [Nephila pilipes]|uniref:Uncharacterized protein n=1 Tax=Nephila pilipes TaxID=299642 RepID=A0A8X6N2W3_NEPPI|nr:hypothetical protein NPIL_621501 [Nephila pilipes]GFT25962.1 hypothetical protein NPIL_194521 [Nephila pilipes]
MEQEDEDDTANSSAEPDLHTDLPSLYESSDIQHLEAVEENSVPSVNNYTCNPRNMVWRVLSMDIVQNTFMFEGNIEYPFEILDLETPFNFLVLLR